VLPGIWRIRRVFDTSFRQKGKASGVPVRRLRYFYRTSGGLGHACYGNVRPATPSINDSRVSFHIGLFQDSLPPFLRTFRAGKSHLVIHCDADLYSSTLFVLTQLAPYMDGAVVLFDEFNALPHEFRALQDFSRAYRMSYRLIGDVHPRLQRAAFEFYAGEKQPCTAPNLAGFVNGSS